MSAVVSNSSHEASPPQHPSPPRRRGSIRPAVIARPLAILHRVLDAAQPLFALATRVYVSWQFLKSGWLKITSWDVTISLFTDEYKVPLLPPALAAVVGTFGELFFPILLLVGIAGRVGALGLFAVNAMAVISYAHVLYSEGFEAALGQHYLWGFMLLMLALYGPGALSADAAIASRNGRRAM